MNHLLKIFTISILLLLSCTAESACINTESESNDSKNSANANVCNNQLIESSIRNSSDIDWYSLEAATGVLSISIDHHRRDDFDFEITDSSGTTILRAATSARPELASIDVSAGTYFVRVNSYRGRGWYDLVATFEEDSGNEPPSNDCEFGSRPNIPGGLQVWLTGNDSDSCPDISGNEGVLLMGGNFDVDEAFVNRVKPRINGGDVVVLRTSGTDGYNDYLQNLLASDSVETILVDSVNKANSDYVEWAIQSAEFVFIAGGDQSDYLNQWQGTKVQAALKTVYAKGGVIGGTSAGAMLQGEWIYDPDNIYSVYSEEAVTDPCHQYINVSTGFLETQLLDNVIVDTHFAQRDRMGRLAAFMSQRTGSILGVGVDEDTSIFIDANGNGIVDGDNAVYVLSEDSATERTQTACGSELIYEDIKQIKLLAGQSYDFAQRHSNTSSTRLTINGNNQNFYNPTNPY